MTDAVKLTRKDFVSDQTVRWCPGCGDYAILAQMQKILPDLGVAKEDIVFISGIGCSSRFPYYMNTYGIHSIHGRAPTLATGLKIANPDLTVFVITGDGDGLSIGGNHLVHAIRRNIDINIILFNNRIYGLTKGQYSPTSLPGAKTKSSPMGSIEQSFNPISVAIGAETTFVARTIDANVKHMAETLKRAAEHKGTSFVEIYQNCVIFNDGAWEHVTDRDVKDDNMLPLEHGKPMIFGKDLDKGIVLDGLEPRVVNLSEVEESQLLVHDEKQGSPALAYLLSRMEFPNYPAPIGVLRDIDMPVYEEQVIAQVETAKQQRGDGTLRDLYHKADTWEVTEQEALASRATGEMPQHLDEEYLDKIDEDGEVETPEHDLMVDTIGSLVRFDPITVHEGVSLAEAIDTMQSKDIGALLVTDDDGRLTGIFTEMDVLRRVACLVTDLDKATLGDFMTPNPSSVYHNQAIAYGLHLMALHHFRHVPIVDDDNKPIGIISFRDVVSYLEKYF